MTPLLDLGALIAKPVSEVLGIISKATTDKDERLRLMTEFMTLKEQGSQEEILALIAQQTEVFKREPKNGFDSFVDGMNRLVRPLVTYGVIGLFTFMCFNPEQYLDVAKGAEITPAWMWALIATVIGFWFGGRALKDWQQFIPFSRNQEKSLVVQEQQTNVKAPPQKPQRRFSGE